MATRIFRSSKSANGAPVKATPLVRFEQDVIAVQGILHEAFGDKLKTYHVNATEISMLGDKGASLSRPNRNAIHLVNFQDEESATATEEPAEETPVETEATPKPETTTSAVSSDPYAGGSSFDLNFEAGGDDSGISYDTVKQLLQDALDATGHSGAAVSVSNDNYQFGSARRFTSWSVKLALPEAVAQEVIGKLEASANNKPIFPLANKIGGRVAGDMTTKAIAAIVISLLGIIAYIWIRFQHVMYGVAAVGGLGPRRACYARHDCPECLGRQQHPRSCRQPDDREIPDQSADCRSVPDDHWLLA